MWKLVSDFQSDERGCVPAMEWVLVASILTLGVMAGMLAMQHAEEIGAAERPAIVTR